MVKNLYIVKFKAKYDVSADDCAAALALQRFCVFAGKSNGRPMSILVRFTKCSIRAYNYTMLPDIEIAHRNRMLPSAACSEREARSSPRHLQRAQSAKFPAQNGRTVYGELHKRLF